MKLRRLWREWLLWKVLSVQAGTLVSIDIVFRYSQRIAGMSYTIGRRRQAIRIFLLVFCTQTHGSGAGLLRSLFELREIICQPALQIA